MKRERINSLLHALGSKPSGYRAGWVLASCVLAPWTHANGNDADPSFAIKSSDKKKSICKCLSCGFGGDLYDLLFRIRDLNKAQPTPKVNMSLAANIVGNEYDDMELNAHALPDYGDAVEPEYKEVVFSEFWLSSFQTYSKFPDAIRYLDKRGVGQKLARYLDLRYDPMQKRIGFPYRNFNGELMGVQGRSIDPTEELRYFQYGFKNHRNSHVWMGEQMLDLDQPVVVLEGPFDLASVFRVYQNVAASFTSGLSVHKVKRLADAAEIITFYDYGSGGNAARKKLREVLKGMPIQDIIPAPELGDAGAMSVPQVVSCLEGLVKLNYISEAR